MWLLLAQARVRATPVRVGTCRNKWLSMHQVIKPAPLAAVAEAWILRDKWFSHSTRILP
jgi:hypothetical protein